MTTAIKTAENSQPDQLQEMERLIAEKKLRQIPKVGEIIDGKVISVSKSEVHLDLDGLTTGVVRGRELYDESGDYSNLKVGDQASATVLDLENEKGEMELSFMHAGHRKAWDHLEELRATGAVIPAKIISANKGGLMARVGKVAGFLPVSQLSVDNYPRVEGGDRGRILEKLNKLINQTMDVKVIDIDEKEEKLIVSEKAAWEEAQKETIAKYNVGDVVDGKVTGVVDFGVFVEFGPGLEGLVHISELAWQRIDSPADIVKVGDQIKAQIISIDGAKISLSMKKLQEDPWKKEIEKFKVGDQIKGKILKVNPFGLFVELTENIHGLAHISELSDEPIKNPRDHFKTGDQLDFKIISIEPDNHRLGLSLRERQEAQGTRHKEEERQPTEDTPETAEEKK
ncbi:MAG TPA: S1 RNA-binding domain-containing protein [Patescibacteria group bacterium]